MQQESSSSYKKAQVYSSPYGYSNPYATAYPQVSPYSLSYPMGTSAYPQQKRIHDTYGYNSLPQNRVHTYGRY